LTTPASCAKAYTFLSQIIDYGQPDLEKRYIFYKALAAVISMEGIDVVEVNLAGINLTHYRITAGPAAKLDLERRDCQVNGLVVSSDGRNTSEIVRSCCHHRVV
jgi:hypothetical protein